MADKEFLGMLVFGLCTLIGLISAVVVPLIKLNVTLTKLQSTIDTMAKKEEVYEYRINRHGEEIDRNTKTLINHEARIEHLEKKEE